MFWEHLFYALTMLISRDIFICMNRIKVLKRFFLIFFLLHFVSFVMLPLVCLTEEIFSPGTDHNSCCNLPNQTDHSPPVAKHKLPCPNNHSCCNFITPNTTSHFFALSSSQITPVEISFQPREITGFVFRPPETRV